MTLEDPSPLSRSIALDSPDRLLTTHEAAQLLQLGPSTLTTWRSTGRVRLPFVQIGRAVRYRLSDLRSFIDRSLA
jgi:excisionase family DNA binding protein